jgi:aryl-alcohol dehydrogenase-like predicted oxidoreductase
MKLLHDVELGTGTWQWGDRRKWGYGGDYGEADIRAAFDASLDAGVRFFDTAETYGHGRSEKLLGWFAEGHDVVISTKFMPRPWRLWQMNLQFALEQSLRRLGLARVDVYQIHFPDPPVPIETWMDGLADAVERGLARAVGVSNYDLEQTRRAHAALARRGVPLATLQRHYSLLDRGAETQLRYCLDHGIRFIAWSPLEKGLLSGKYSAAQPPPGERHRDYREMLNAIAPLITLLRTLGAERRKTPAQVALNWTICKGALPIPGAKNAAQARENAGALGWRLGADEVALLDATSASLVT